MKWRRFSNTEMDVSFVFEGREAVILLAPVKEGSADPARLALDL
jgi:hypothetical protein